MPYMAPTYGHLALVSAAHRPPEVSFDFWLDGPNRVEEFGSEISDILIIRSDIEFSGLGRIFPPKCRVSLAMPCDVNFDFFFSKLEV